MEKAAKELGCNQRTLKRLCKRHGIGLEISKRVHLIPRNKLPALRRLKRPGPGNPNFGKTKKETR